MECRICGNAVGNREYVVREMMYGIRDEHTYFQCQSCDCLQISSVPDNIATYYQNSYYSYAKPKKQSYLRQFLVTARDSYAIKGKGWLGRAVSRRFPHRNCAFLEPLRASLTPNSRILDVGCGSGQLLTSFHNAGYTNGLGVDPFLDEDLVYPNGLRIQKCTLDEIGGEFDLIMFHHSFEHIPDQDKTLEKVRKLLAPQGWCVIRIPMVDCSAWQIYGTNWVQIDAPRHFFLHSRRSLNQIAARNGLSVRKVVYDSSGFQFWGSEQYVRDIPLRDPRSYAVNPSQSIFSEQDLMEFTRRADELNTQQIGDQASFYLQRSS